MITPHSECRAGQMKLQSFNSGSKTKEDRQRGASLDEMGTISDYELAGLVQFID